MGASRTIFAAVAALVAGGFGMMHAGVGASTIVAHSHPVTSSDQVFGTWQAVELFGKVVPSPPDGSQSPNELAFYPADRKGDRPSFGAGDGASDLGGSFTVGVDGRFAFDASDTGSYGCTLPEPGCNTPDERAVRQARRLLLTPKLDLLLVDAHGHELGEYRKVLAPAYESVDVRPVTSVDQLEGRWNPVSIETRPITVPPDYSDTDDLVFDKDELVVGDGCSVSNAAYALHKHGRIDIGPFSVGSGSCGSRPTFDAKAALSHSGAAGIDGAGRLVLNDGIRGYPTAVYERADLHDAGAHADGLTRVTDPKQVLGTWHPIRELGIRIDVVGKADLTFRQHGLKVGEGCGYANGSYHVSPEGRFHPGEVYGATCEQTQEGGVDAVTTATWLALDEHGLLRLFDDNGAEVGAFSRHRAHG